MSCRESAAGSAFTTWARLNDHGRLSEVATLSLFHELRRRYNAEPVASRRVRTEEEYHGLLDRQIRRTEQGTVLTAARQASVLARLRLARTSPMPDQSIVNALFNITPQVRERANNLDRFYDDIATRSQSTIDEVRTEFNRLSNSVQRGRANRAEYTEAQLAAIAMYGLGNEEGVRHAVTVLNEQAQAVTATLINNSNSRIILKPITEAREQETDIPNLRMIAVGYDPRNRRLEVKIHDDSTGLDTVYAYRNVTESTANYITGVYNYGNNGKRWATSVRGLSQYAYPSIEAAALAGVAPHCSSCGQFAAAGHGCPMRVEPSILSPYRSTSRWSNQTITLADGHTVKVQLPAIKEFRAAYNAGAVKVEGFRNNFYVDGNWGNLSGSITAYQDDANVLRLNTSQMVCACDLYRQNETCPHIDVLSAAVKTRLIPGPTLRTARSPEERAQILAEATRVANLAAVNDWTRTEETLEEARKTWHKNSEILYSEAYEKFEEVYLTAVKQRKENGGKPVIPYQKENVLKGLATRESGQGFGVEIEYTFPEGTDSYQANARIGAALLAANLTSHSGQRGYHSAGPGGVYPKTHVDANGKGTWSWERDGSVQNGGEIVSPTMYDESETWDGIEKVLKILSDNGAVMSKKAGGHVHIGTGFYQGDPAKYTELARMMTQHEDVLYRIAADPIRGTHRQSRYAPAISSVREEGFTDISRVRYETGRNALNYAHVQGAESDHPEFRIFDGTLDPGAVQAHIKVAVSMAHAAARISGEGGTKRKKEPVGSHSKRMKAYGRRNVPTEVLKEDTATFRSFLDTIFQDKEDKDQLTAVFANTQWPTERGIAARY